MRNKFLSLFFVMILLLVSGVAYQTAEASNVKTNSSIASVSKAVVKKTREQIIFENAQKAMISFWYDQKTGKEIKTFTKAQIYQKLGKYFHPSFIARFIKYDFNRAGRDSRNNTLYTRALRGDTAYGLIFEMSWDKKYAGKDMPKIKYTKKGAYTYLTISQYIPGEEEGNYTYFVYFIKKTNSKEPFRLYEHSWKQGKK